MAARSSRRMSVACACSSEAQASNPRPVELHPGRARAGHGVRPEGIAWVEVGGDPERLRDWLGGEELPILLVDGPSGIHRVAIATADGELVIG